MIQPLFSSFGKRVAAHMSVVSAQARLQIQLPAAATGSEEQKTTRVSPFSCSWYPYPHMICPIWLALCVSYPATLRRGLGLGVGELLVLVAS